TDTGRRHRTRVTGTSGVDGARGVAAPGRKRLSTCTRAAPHTRASTPGRNPTSEDCVMATPTRKTELSPLEAIVVETALGEEALRLGRQGVLARIQQLTKERQKLYAKTAAHPILAPTYAPRIRALAAELELLWELHRRQRASRRMQMERALHVMPPADDG